MGANKTSSGQRRNKETNNQKKCFPMQVLYDTCKEVFENGGSGIVPSPENVQKLMDAMNGMTGADVGLRPGMQIFRPQRKEGLPSMSYIPVYNCNKFSIGIFCLPPSAVIQLHNHPGMTVFCKLLFGIMYVNSFDWVNANPPNEDGVFSTAPLRTANGEIPAGALRLAKTKADNEVSAPCNTSVLYPADGGNLHSFRALKPCAFLDVLAPPYNDSEGRHCTFYRKYNFSSLPEAGTISVPEEHRQEYAWLQETEKVEGSLIYGKEYTGPKIVTE
ncbi:hypothetical protein ACET3Z_011320 [Daucus carota]